MTAEQAAQMYEAVRVLVYVGECCLFVMSLRVGYLLGKGRR